MSAAILKSVGWREDAILGNYPPTPPLGQRSHLCLTQGKMLGHGRGGWEVSQTLKLIRSGSRAILIFSGHTNKLGRALLTLAATRVVHNIFCSSQL